MFRFLRLLCLAFAPGFYATRASAQVTVELNPTGGVFTNPNLTVTIKFCNHTGTYLTNIVVMLNWVDVTEQLEWVGWLPGCSLGMEYRVPLQLQLGNNDFYAEVSDNYGPVWATAEYLYSTNPRLPASLGLAYADKFRDPSRCIADCFASVAQYSTPTYTSLDQARGVSLLYRSDRARPTGIVQINATDVSPAPVEKYSLLLKRPGPNGTFVDFVNGQQEIFFVGAAGTTRLVAQFDASGLATGAYDYTAVVRSHWSGNPPTVIESTIPARVLIVNGASSAFGAGWEIAGLQTATVTQPDGSPGVLIAAGDGSISFFGDCSGTCQLTSPPGDFSTLIRLSDGTYERRYPDGTKYVFGSSGLLTEIRDRLGIATSIGRDGSNRITSITDPAGFATSLAYGGAGGTLSLITIPGTAGASRTSSFTVSGGVLEQACDPDGIRNLLAAYSSQRLTNLTDRRGGAWSYSYAVDDGLEHADAPTINVSGVGNMRPRTTVAGPARALFVRIASGYGSSGSPVPRNADDLRASVKNPRNNITYFTTNRWGSPTQVDFPAGPSATATYHATTGQMTQSVAPGGHTINYAWNGVQLTQIQDVSASQTVNATYEGTYNRPLTITGNTVARTFTYPDARTITMQAGSHPATVIKLDYFGRDSLITDGGGHQSAKYYFSTAGLRNTDSVEAPGARRTRLRYDAFGRLIARVAPNGDRDSSSYDVIDRRLTATDANNKTTSFNYDSLFLRKVTDARGQEYVFVRNALGWVEQETRPGSTAIASGYDANGNVVTQTNRRSQTITFGYDALDRNTSRTADGQTTTFAYFVTATPFTQSYVAATNAESTDTLYISAAGRVSPAVTRRGNNWYRIGHGYNANGTLAYTLATSNTWSGDKTQSFTYNATGALQYFDTWAGRTTLNPGTDNEDLATSITYPSGLVSTRAFTSLHGNYNQTYNDGYVNLRLGAKIKLDVNGRILFREKPNADSARTYLYANGRLSLQNRYSVQPDGGCTPNPDYGWQCSNVYQFIGDDQFSYDDAGNLLNGSAQIAGSSNRLLSAHGYTFNYDADGNDTSKVGLGLTQSLSWNALGQLTSVTTNGVNVTFGYDGFGRRVRKTVNGVTTSYLHDGDNLFMELNAGGSPVAEYAYWGLDNPHSMQKGGQTYYFVQDPVGGSVKGLVRHSDNTVQAQYGYTMFGQQEGTVFDNVGNMLRFAGREYDSETGLYFNRARYFDPVVGRFVSEDPIGLGGGINPYAYAGNDVVNSSDPFGLQSCTGTALLVANSSVGTPVPCTPTGGHTGGLPPIGTLPGPDGAGTGGGSGGGGDPTPTDPSKRAKSAACLGQAGWLAASVLGDIVTTRAGQGAMKALREFQRHRELAGMLAAGALRRSHVTLSRLYAGQLSQELQVLSAGIALELDKLAMPGPVTSPWAPVPWVGTITDQLPKTLRACLR